MKFKQSGWMKKYIDLNTEKRINSANCFEKYFFKLMIISVYSKTMEKLRKRISVRIVNNEKAYLKYTGKPNFISRKILGKNFAAIHEIEPVLTLNRPVYVGFTVLKLSKWLMHDLHYNFIEKHFDAELLFTDTNSLVYEIKSENIYEELFKHKNLFNFREHRSEFFDETNKKVAGKMKDVHKGKPICEFVGLKAKCILFFQIMVKNLTQQKE